MILALLERQPDHGYSLMLRLRGQTGIEISDGSLYPALYRLEQAGKIEGSWERAQTGHRRKVFTVTRKGKQILRKARVEWPKLAVVLERLLGGSSSDAPSTT